MNANTNGFNFTSDYQGHNGSTILIFFVILFGVFMIGSFNKGNPSSVTDNDGVSDKASSVNQDNGVIDDSIEEDTSDDSSIDKPKGAIFEMYQ